MDSAGDWGTRRIVGGLALTMLVSCARTNGEPRDAAPAATTSSPSVSAASATVPQPLASAGEQSLVPPPEMPPTGWYDARIETVSDTCSPKLYTGRVGAQYVVGSVVLGALGGRGWRVNYPTLPTLIGKSDGPPRLAARAESIVSPTPPKPPPPPSSSETTSKDVSATGFTIVEVVWGGVDGGAFHPLLPTDPGVCRSQRSLRFDLVKACASPCKSIFEPARLQRTDPNHKEPCVCPGDPDYDRAK